MEKISTFLTSVEEPAAIPLFNTQTDSYFEKTASVKILPKVASYINKLKPRQGSQYVLVNALGASEYWGSNSNADAFCEAGLKFEPKDFVKGTNARCGSPYGYLTFYDAKPFLHHKNKNPDRGYGEVELSEWNPFMKRVELVTRIDKEKCDLYGGERLWYRLENGEYPDVSMGTRIPFDTCSIHLDAKLYEEARRTFNPAIHEHEGIAILEFHKKRSGGIPGLHITRRDYCREMQENPNKVLPTGIKIFVDNDYTYFFDISFVFIGADKTAKAMLHIKTAKVTYSFAPQTKTAADLTANAMEKVAEEVNLEDGLQEMFLGKIAKEDKKAEIIKQIPSNFAPKAVALVTPHEEDLPESLLRRLRHGHDKNTLLSTLSGLGIILKPQEYESCCSCKCPCHDKGVSSCPVNTMDAPTLDPMMFDPLLARLCMGMFRNRSLLSPAADQRAMLVIRIHGDGGDKKQEEEKKTSSHKYRMPPKLAQAYTSYRESVMEFLEEIPTLISRVEHEEATKCASLSLPELFSPFSAAYAKLAFLNAFRKS